MEAFGAGRGRSEMVPAERIELPTFGLQNVFINRTLESICADYWFANRHLHDIMSDGC